MSTHSGTWASEIGVVAVASSFCLPCSVAVLTGPSVPLAFTLAGVTAAVSGCCALLRWRRAAMLSLVVVAAAMGIARGALAAPGAPWTPHAGAVVVDGVVRDTPVARRTQSLVLVDLDHPAASQPASVEVPVLGRSSLLPGDRVRLEAVALRPPDTRAGPLSASTLGRAGVDAVAVTPRLTLIAPGDPGIARSLAMLRLGIAGRIDAVAGEPDATLLSGIAFGIHGSLPTSTRTSLQDSGLIHLVATSGLKVAIVAALVARLLALAAAGPKTRRLITAAAILCYIAVGGAGAAAIRSAVMAFVGLALYGTGRRTRQVPLLATVAAAMLLVDPHLCGDAGFQLSFLGTLGIVLFAARISRRIPGPRLIVEPFAVTLAAELATAPVMGATFGSISLVGPVANAVVIPLVPVVSVFAWLGVALATVAPPLGAIPLAAATLLTRCIEKLAEVLGSLPGAALHVPAWPRPWTFAELAALAAALAVAAALRSRIAPPPEITVDVRHPETGRDRPSMPRALRRAPALGAVLAAGALASSVVLAVAARPDGSLHVDVLAVGSSSAVLVRTVDGATALVDGGADPAGLLAAIGPEIGSGDIDALVLTGGERSAVAGLADLGTRRAVGRVIVPEGPLGTQARASVLALREAGSEVVVIPPGTAWQWRGAAWRFLSLGVPVDAMGSPILPLCALQVSEAGATALLLGDAAVPAQEQLAVLGAATLRSDLLVTPPGGLLSPALLGAVTPTEIAVPSLHRPKVDPAVPSGVTVRATSVDGTLHFRSLDAGGMEAG